MQLLLFALCSLVPGFTLASNPNDINPALAPRQQEEEQKALAHLDRDPFFRSPHEHPFHYQRREAPHYHRFTHPDPSQSHALHDTLLLASVDGKFHAVSRSTGHALWSMASSPDTTSVSAPHELGALVRTGRTTSRTRSSLKRRMPPKSTIEDEDEEDELQDEGGTSHQQKETYIIEPQSGSIYILSSPSSPLQRFPLTMQELVDISPFTSSIPPPPGAGDAGEQETRVFVGRKETSLILLELETGRVKATLNSECPFVGWEGSAGEGNDDDDAAGEDGERRRRKKHDRDRDQISAPTEVYIGRTDYHISIYSKFNPSHKESLFNPPLSSKLHLIQNLSFSTYGPNNQHTHLQALYGHTQDGRYVQGLPNGEVIAFRVEDGWGGEEEEDQKRDRKGSEPLWGHSFGAPIVAIFDVLLPSDSTSNHNKSPFVLLQPRPGIQDLFPSLSAPPSSPPSPDLDSEAGGETTDAGANPPKPERTHTPPPSTPPLLPNFGSAYIGLLEETESLYLMSPERFPLVLFGGSGLPGPGSPAAVYVGDGENKKEKKGGRRGYRPDGEMEDVVFRVGPVVPSKEKEKGGGKEDTETLLDKCLDNPHDLRCLVGIRPLVEDVGDDDEYGHGYAGSGGSRSLGPGPRIGYPSGYGNYGHPSYYGRPRRLLDGPNKRGAELPLPLPNQSPPAVLPGSSRPDGEREGEEGVERDAASSRSGSSSSSSSSWFPSFSGMRNNGSGMLGETGTVGGRRNGDVQGLWQGLLLVLVLGVLWIGVVLKRKEKRGGSEKAKEVVGGEESEVKRPTALDLPLAPDSKLELEVGVAMEVPFVSGDGLQKDNNSDEVLRTATPTPAANGVLEIPVSAAPATPGTATSLEVDESDGEAEDGGGAGGVMQAKKKARRGKRGRRKRGGVVAGVAGDAEEKEKEKPTTSLVLTSSPRVAPVQTSLVVSDTILGFGSHGTVVLQGSLQGRSVAVKRLLRDFVTLAQREVSILQESDDHPNVIRYFYQETHENFLYIALELCPASLADVIESPQRDEVWMDINRCFEPKRALKQVTSGLRHLHGLKIVHRDIKPQNILISAAKGGNGTLSSGSSPSSSSSGTTGNGYRMLISDFGLCKKLDVDQTSFLPTAHGAHAAGTVGWRAPEILRGEVKLDEVVGEDGTGSISSRGSVATVAGGSSSSSSNGNGNGNGGPLTKTLARLTKSVDIFSLGCLFYYTLTNGGHPYGDRFEREVNIMKDAKDVGGVERFGEEGTEAKQLILEMVEFEAGRRPDTHTILQHPYFWDSHKRLTFLQDVSDRFEIMCRDPKDPRLLTLETEAMEVVGNDWHSRLDKVFVENLGKYRKYDGKSVQDLLRALRNKKHHYQDLPDHVKRHLGPMPEGFLAYFTKRFPRLFLHVHGVVKETGLNKEAMFRAYFEVPGDT